MTKDKTVTMSRELAEKILSELEEFHGSELLGTVCTADELCAILAAPIVEADGMGEAVAEVYRGPVSGINRIRWIKSRTQPVGSLLYASPPAPPAPVSVILPSTEDFRNICRRAARQADLISGANYHTAAELAADALIDKVKELNQI